MLIAHGLTKSQHSDYYVITLLIDSFKFKGNRLTVHSTTDEWKTVDVFNLCSYENHSPVKLFCFYAMKKRQNSSRFLYAIKDSIKWDNNKGWNYCLNFNNNDCLICYDEEKLIVIPKCFHSHRFCTDCVQKLNNVCALCKKDVMLV